MNDEELEKMLKNDPELFYNNLCYSQVLGLTDQWKHKFDKYLNTKPPQWIMSSETDYIDFNSLYNLIDHFKIKIFDNLVDSRSSSDSNNFDYDHNEHDHSSEGFGGGGGYGNSTNKLYFFKFIVEYHIL